MSSSPAHVDRSSDVEGPVLDVARMRADFPALGAFTHLDGTGGTQVPRKVAEAIGRALVTSTSHHGSRTPPERTALDAMSAARAGIADLVGGDPAGVIFGRNMTELTFRMARTIAKTWKEGDEIVVSRLDHGANVAPWVIEAERAGCLVRWVDFDPGSTELRADDVAGVLSERTRLVALTAASNLTGTRVPVRDISTMVHDVGALLYVDGVHLTPHALVDIEDLGADFFVAGTHKLFGPHCAALVAAPALLEALTPDRLPSGPHEVPDRFDVGTPPYEVLAGVAATVDYLAELADYTVGAASAAAQSVETIRGSVRSSGQRRQQICRAMDLIERHERTLIARMEERFSAVVGLRRMSLAKQRTPTELVVMEGVSPEDLFLRFAADEIAVSVGRFHAMEASRALGLGADGGVRVGLVAYNTLDEVDLAARVVTRFHQ
ncbi:cysteine desulfurase-like protein [Nocardioides sp. LHD-245]|uniref:cysteine desulfurase-like protein n=1 Tax=Nocardioides sp. LHD-245 TaxID=3051387 RepID=UPI0027E135F7|nr:cysteine desulfurase-like protein [Nocardioides sp. LHD-245]